MKVFGTLLIAVALTGCAFKVTMMPRDGGKTYEGQLQSDGGSGGTMSITIDDVSYTGPIMKVGSNSTFGFAQAYGSNSRGTTARASAFTQSYGDSFFKAILSGSGGKGLRCDISGRIEGGGGVCVDDAGKVYDVIYAPN